MDKKFLRLSNVMGSDLDIVNAARVSFDKEVSELSEKDESLITYLIKNKHDSTLRHCVMSFEVYAPLMVARQWYKHVVASAQTEDQLGWNESSRRYITEREEFYLPAPNEWRSAPASMKQGSGENVDVYVGAKYSRKLERIIQVGEEAYREALADGLAPEQARLLLPAYAMYVRWRWTASLNAVLHFLSLRTHEHAQSEIRAYADGVQLLVDEHFPLASAAWKEYR